MKIVVLISLCYFFVIPATAQEWYRSDELKINKATLNGLSDTHNLVVSFTEPGVHTICLFRDNKLIQQKSITSAVIRSECTLKAILEKGNFVYVFLELKDITGWSDGAITFYKDASRDPFFDKQTREADLVFSYTFDEGFHSVFLDKKKDELHLKTYYSNQLAYSASIPVKDKNVLKILKKNFTFIHPSTTDFELLSSEYKVFADGARLALLIDKDEASVVFPKLRVIKLDFSGKELTFHEVKLPLQPDARHCSYLFDKKIFSWGLSQSIFTLNVIDSDSLKEIKMLTYFKDSDSLELKATKINYLTGVQSNDKEWQWEDDEMKMVDETKVSSILKNFLKGRLLLKVSEDQQRVKLIFGSYQKESSPSRRDSFIHAVPGSAHSTSMSYYSLGMVERMKFFSGFMNPLTLSPDQTPGSQEDMNLRSTVYNRAKSILEEESINSIAVTVGFDSGYIIYILKKGKDMVIEQIK